MVASKIPTLDLKFEVVMPFLQASTPYLANHGEKGAESTQLLFSLNDIWYCHWFSILATFSLSIYLFWFLNLETLKLNGKEKSERKFVWNLIQIIWIDENVSKCILLIVNWKLKKEDRLPYEKRAAIVYLARSGERSTWKNLIVDVWWAGEKFQFQFDLGLWKIKNLEYQRRRRVSQKKRQKGDWQEAEQWRN